MIFRQWCKAVSHSDVSVRITNQEEHYTRAAVQNIKPHKFIIQTLEETARRIFVRMTLVLKHMILLKHNVEL